jgi:hypothetical protein
MTEPDEALIWARLQNGNPAKPRTITDNYRAGLMAHGYRAGQAASAERIKALEGLLRECADDLEEEIQARSANDLPRRIERDMEPVKKARALLKEADHD